MLNFHQIIKTIKAITKINDININSLGFDHNFFTIEDSKLLDPKILTLPNDGLDIDLRAIADLSCCYYLFHNKDIANAARRKHSLTFNQFNLVKSLEKIRISFYAKNFYLGIAKNITSKAQKDIFLTAIDDKNTIIQLLLTGEMLNDSEQIDLCNDFEEVFFQSKLQIKESIIDKVSKLCQYINDQDEFTNLSAQISKVIDCEDIFNQNNESTNQDNQKVEPAEVNNNDNKQSSASKSVAKSNDDNEASHDPNQKQQQEKSAISKNIDNDSRKNIKPQTATSDHGKNQESVEFYSPYKVFTNSHDQIILPEKIVDKDSLQELRKLLDQKIDNIDNISKRLKTKFRQKLISKQNSTIKTNQHEGVIDRKKLSQIISSPFKRNFHKARDSHKYENTMVTILLDNSGSMRGKPIAMSAIACEVISNLLEQFAIKTEILGFTTADWKGGKAKKLWEEKGRPENPGRLNDLRHIIYKPANINFRKLKSNLGLMLKEGFLKENIDGEAILWAKSRLMQAAEERKILIIISDGNPVDDSTNAANDDQILIDHLQHVINKVEKEKKIELVAIGIGHDVSRYYRNAIAIKNIEDLGDVLVKKIIDLV